MGGLRRSYTPTRKAYIALAVAELNEAWFRQCPECHAPVLTDGTAIARHPEQIVAAHRWVDGYLMCFGSGTPLTNLEIS